GLIPIKDVRIGDRALSFDEKTGKFVEQPVVHLIQQEKTEEYVILGLDNGETIEATREHPFYVAGTWVKAGDLKVADVLTASTGRPVRVSAVRRETRTAKAYNLEVANTHTYVLSDEGLVVHNAGPCRYSGRLLRVPKGDPQADLLAARLGGTSRVKFENDPLGREFDVVSNAYIGQVKPALKQIGSDFRSQAKATFEAAKETGRKVYYKFDGEPTPEVIRKLKEYSARYDVELVIDTARF
ncbi:MAG: polymorphic toxin-type HINT domain-containing protein, partial [Nitrospirota bacterium]